MGKKSALKLPTPLYTFIVLLRFDALKIYLKINLDFKKYIS
jgi:hypothetical protein